AAAARRVRAPQRPRRRHAGRRARTSTRRTGRQLAACTTEPDLRRAPGAPRARRRPRRASRARAGAAGGRHESRGGTPMRRSALAVAVAVMLGAIGPATADERRGGFRVATAASTGGPGNDTLYGGPGNDRFLCGPGFDVAYITSSATSAARATASGSSAKR